MLGTAGKVSTNSCNVLLRTSTRRHSSIGWSAKTYDYQVCEETGWSLKDLVRAMADRYRWWDSIDR